MLPKPANCQGYFDKMSQAVKSNDADVEENILNLQLQTLPPVGLNNVQSFRSNRPKFYIGKGPRKMGSEKMQQSYRRTPMPKCDFNKVALSHELTRIHI